MQKLNTKSQNGYNTENHSEKKSKGDSKFSVNMLLLVDIYSFQFCTTSKSYSIIRWMNSLLGEGYKKELEMEDIFEVRKQDESEVLGDRLEKYIAQPNEPNPIKVCIYLGIGSKK